MSENMSVAAIVAVLVSLLLEWFPALKTWWEKFSSAQKQGMMAATVAVISAVVVVGNCYWWGETCPEKWTGTLLEIFLTFLAAAGVQQGVHLLTKKPE